MPIMSLLRNRWRAGVLLAALAFTLSLPNAALPLMAQQERKPRGTAFVVHPDGYLLTCSHVVMVMDAANVQVAIGDKSYEATVLGMDEKRDLALLQIKANGLPALPLGNSNVVEDGEEVRAFGFPLASGLGDTVKVTRGTVSVFKEGQNAQKVFRVDAGLNPGNSGGPLVNEKGEVIGVANAGSIISGVGYAVPINYAKPLLRDERVEFTTAGAGAKLDSHALVKRVSPAVALVTITLKPSAAPAATVTPASPELVRTLTGHSNSVTSVAFSPDGKTIASGSHDKTVKLWDAGTGELKRTLTGHTDWVMSVAFSPDGKIVASGTVDGTVGLWDAGSGELKQTLTGHNGEVWAVAFSPDGKTLASGTADWKVRLWNAGTGQLKRTLTGHNNWVRSVAFSPDGKTLASGSDDKTVRLWDAGTGELKRMLTGHRNSVTSVAFSPDGKTLASGSDDETVRLWRIE